MITELKKRFGNKCTGIKLNYEGSIVNTSALIVNTLSIKLRFCEAVNLSLSTPILLNNSSLSCKGSKRSFGLTKSVDKLNIHISNESKASEEIIKKALHDIPAFETPVKNVFLGIPNEMEDLIHPDMFILQMKPKYAMDLMKLCIIRTNTFPVIKPYPFLSVCGSIVAGTYNQNQMSFSFGCPESRKYGGVDDENVIVGIPFNLCLRLFN